MIKRPAKRPKSARATRAVQSAFIILHPQVPAMGDDALPHAEAERHDGEDGVHAAVVDVEGAVRHEEVREVPHAPPGVAHALRRVAPA